MGTGNLRGSSPESVMGRDAQQLKYLLVLHPHCVGAKKFPDRKNNDDSARHTAGTAIFQNWGGGGGLGGFASKDRLPPPPRES